MPPKHKLIKDAKQSLREHGAETQLQVTNQRQIQSILRPRSAEPEIQAYRSSSHINQAQSTSRHRPVINQSSSSPRMPNPTPIIDTNTDTQTSSSSSSSDDSNDSDGDADDVSYARPPKQPRTELSSVHLPYSLNNPTKWIIPSAMPLPTFTIDQDIRFFIQDISAYLEDHTTLSERQRVRLVQSALKGTAREVLLGYTDNELDTVQKLFHVLTAEFAKKEKYVRNLYKLKQDDDEPVNLFATRIRRYVKGLGLTGKHVDKTCLEYLKLGAHTQIQKRLYNIRKFSTARRIAMETESERGKQTKGRQDTINATESTSTNCQTPEALTKQIMDLCATVQAQQNHIQAQYQQITAKTPPTSNSTMTPTPLARPPYQVKGECFHCHKKGHSYRQCRHANETEKQKIQDRLTKSWAAKRINPHEAANHLNSNTASSTTERRI